MGGLMAGDLERAEQDAAAFIEGARDMVRYAGGLLLLLIAAGAGVGRARAETDPVMAMFLGYSKAVNAVALSPDGNTLVVLGQDYTLTVWDVKTEKQIRQLEFGGYVLSQVCYSPNGALLAVCGNIGSGKTTLVEKLSRHY